MHRQRWILKFLEHKYKLPTRLRNQVMSALDDPQSTRTDIDRLIGQVRQATFGGAAKGSGKMLGHIRRRDNGGRIAPDDDTSIMRIIGGRISGCGY